MIAFLAAGARALASASKLSGWAGAMRGCELTRKDRRLSSGLALLDRLLQGGLVRGRITEIVARGFGWTSLAAAFVAAVTRCGEAAVWIGSADAFDPASMAMADIDLERVLWVAADGASISSPLQYGAVSSPPTRQRWTTCQAAELVLNTCGFGLVVIDLSGRNYPLAPSAAL